MDERKLYEFQERLLGELRDIAQAGPSLRDRLAMAALPPLIRNAYGNADHNLERVRETTSREAYAYADAMLRARGLKTEVTETADAATCEMVEAHPDGSQNDCGKPGKWRLDGVIACDECKQECDKDPGVYRSVVRIGEIANAPTTQRSP